MARLGSLFTNTVFSFEPPLLIITFFFVAPRSELFHLRLLVCVEGPADKVSLEPRGLLGAQHRMQLEKRVHGVAHALALADRQFEHKAVARCYFHLQQAQKGESLEPDTRKTAPLATSNSTPSSPSPL